MWSHPAAALFEKGWLLFLKLALADAYRSLLHHLDRPGTSQVSLELTGTVPAVTLCDPHAACVGLLRLCSSIWPLTLLTSLASLLLSQSQLSQTASGALDEQPDGTAQQMEQQEQQQEEEQQLQQQRPVQPVGASESGKPPRPPLTQQVLSSPEPQQPAGTLGCGCEAVAVQGTSGSSPSGLYHQESISRVSSLGESMLQEAAALCLSEAQQQQHGEQRGQEMGSAAGGPGAATAAAGAGEHTAAGHPGALASQQQQLQQRSQPLPVLRTAQGRAMAQSQQEARAGGDGLHRRRSVSTAADTAGGWLWAGSCVV